MIDYFALLQQPRKPWLELEPLKQKYQQLTLANHPDLPSSDSAETGASFAEINEAYRVLSDPKLRLQHLLSLEGATQPASSSTPEEFTELFMKTGSLVQEIDRLVEKLRISTNALSRSLLRADLLSVQKRTESLVAELNGLYADAVAELKQSDKVWAEQRKQAIEVLRDVSNRFSYLGRWIDQLRERQFQLAN